MRSLSRYLYKESIVRILVKLLGKEEQIMDMDIYELRELIDDLGYDLSDLEDIEILAHCTGTCDYCQGTCSKCQSGGK